MKSTTKLVLTITLLLIIVAIPWMVAVACNGGKCTNPLPDNANGCDSQGKGPEHKCGNATEVATVQATKVPATPKPVEVTKVAEPTDSPATRVATVVATVQATSEPEDRPEPVLTIAPTATVTRTIGIPPATACGDGDVCDPCDLLLQAIAEGMIVIIANQDQVIMIDGDIVIEGSLLATGLLSETTSD